MSDKYGVKIEGVIGHDLTLSSSIAVVGSSGGLLNGGFGQCIDSHCDIIRFNNAKIDGFEEDLGSRTTVRAIGMTITDNNAIDFGHCRDEIGVKIITKSKNEKYITPLINNKSDIFIFENYHEVAMGTFDRLIKYTGIEKKYDAPPRTGLVIISLLVDAMQGVGPIDIYGFDVGDRASAGDRHHYFRSLSAKDFREKFSDILKTNHCPFEYEWESLSRLSDRSLIRINYKE